MPVRAIAGNAPGTITVGALIRSGTLQGTAVAKESQKDGQTLLDQSSAHGTVRPDRLLRQVCGSVVVRKRQRSLWTLIMPLANQDATIAAKRSARADGLPDQ